MEVLEGETVERKCDSHRRDVKGIREEYSSSQKLEISRNSKLYFPAGSRFKGEVGGCYFLLLPG